MLTVPSSPTDNTLIQTFRASSMQEALQAVRRTLGPDAAVLQAREVRSRWFPWWSSPRQIEVTASSEIAVPSRFPERLERPEPSAGATPRGPQLPGRDVAGGPSTPPAHATDFRLQFREQLKHEVAALPSLVEQLCNPTPRTPQAVWPEALTRVYSELRAAEVADEFAQELIERVRQAASHRDLHDPVLLKARVARLLEAAFRVCGPIQIAPAETRVVALVGPTGVGKTTTVAKLAAHYRLREQRRVGLITVDTYRIAAVEQLRTYAEIMDLPLEVVSTPREARAAIERLSGLDLILVDTAGRSPQDVVKIQELKATLAEAHADEVHLVLSAVASAASLQTSAAQFVAAGATALLVTKLDEATGLGQVLSVVRSSRLPISYVTHGQDVPDDIEPAESRALTRRLLGVDPCFTASAALGR